MQTTNIIKHSIFQKINEFYFSFIPLIKALFTNACTLNDNLINECTEFIIKARKMRRA